MRRACLPADPGGMTDDDSTGATPSRQPDAQPPAERDEEVHVRADSPDAMLALIPHLLGFYPSRSLVVLGLTGQRGRVRVTFRYDLPDPADAVLAADVAEHAASVLRRQRIGRTALVGYGPAALVAPILATTMDWLVADGVQLREVLRADGGRYWSVLCDDPACCPAEGRPFDPGSHPVSAAMAEAGLAALPDRAALARTLQPRPGSAASIRQATRRAERRLCDLGDTEWAAGQREPQAATAEVGRLAVQQAISRYRAGKEISAPDDLAWLSILLADLRVRDDAWARMDPRYRQAHCRLWTDVVKGASCEYVPAPASLLAFTAWQSGNGALASCAVDRALAARPGYSMALLLAGALEAGLPPSAAKLPMTPAEVAQSYADQDGKTPRPVRPPATRATGKNTGRSRTSPKAQRARQSDNSQSRTTRAGSGSRTSGASRRPSG